MATCYTNVFLHFIWQTDHRLPLITPARERSLFRVIRANVQRAGCQTLALNAIPDHVHLLARQGRETTMAALMHQVKGTSSRFMNAEDDRQRNAGAAPEDLPTRPFAWRHGYGVFSVGRTQVPRIIEYIANQKHHHEFNATYPQWETIETDAIGEKIGEQDIG